MFKKLLPIGILIAILGLGTLLFGFYDKTVWTGASPIEFEGATADDYQTTFTFTDPTADATITFPNSTGAVILSTLTTNAPGIANAVTGGTNQLIFEGSSADGFEAIITATNPTADTIWTLPDAAAGTYGLMSTTLATNALDIANSVWGGTSQIIAEGATADAFETTLAFADPGADVTLTIPAPASASSFVLSTLTTNKENAANSIWGVSNGITFEGATADDYETSFTFTDPTADRTITFPNSSGTVAFTVKTGQQFVQSVAYAKVGSAAGWTVGAAADKSLATMAASQTAGKLVIPITIPLKIGWTITAWTINGQIDSAGNTATLDGLLYKHTEAAAGETTAAIGSGMTQLSKTADYKVVDGESGLTQVVAADESYFLLLTGTTALTTDIEIASITVTVSEL